MASKTPHYVRVARALALVTGLAGLPACAVSTTLGTDSGPGEADSGPMLADSGSDTDSGATGDDAGTVADAGSQPDAGTVHTCATCTCTFGVDAGPVVSCEGVGLETTCCAAIGPLFPPDLPA
ncbi:MAG: hypothetical protein M3Y87_18295 [Myxococcota bacterium]|nr:hypothetical protein [Myxococcota bacterium]